MSEWPKISLKDVLDFVVDNRGKTVPTVNDDGIALIATNCVNNVSLYPEFKNVRYVSNKTYDSWFRAHPVPNDILFTLKGSQNGAACLVPDPVNFAIAQDMVALRVNKDTMDSYFLLAALRSRDVQYQIKTLDVSDVIPHLKKGDFDKLKLPNPPLNIQKKIGEMYMMFERKKHQNLKLNQTLEAMAQALFKSWFVDFDPVMDNALASGTEIPEALKAKAEKRLKKFPELKHGQNSPPDSGGARGTRKTNPELAKLFPSAFVFNETLGKWIPQGWEPGEIGMICKSIRNNKPASEINDFEIYVGLEHIDRKNLFLSNTGLGSDVSSNKSAFKKNDILFGKLRPYFHKVCIAPEDGICSTDILVFRAKQDYSRSFLTLALFQEDMVEFVNARSTGTRMPRANQKDILGFQIALPPLELFKAFDQMVYSSLQKATRNIDESKTLTHLRDILLPQLISGKVRVPKEVIS